MPSNSHHLRRESRQMANDFLKEMRAIRRRAELLSRTLVDDYRPFVSPANNVTFFRLPTRSPTSPSDANSTPTCTALMSLCLGGALAHLYGKDANDRAKQAFQFVLADSWTTARLKQNNAFTAALAVRAAGVLAGSGVVDMGSLDSFCRSHDDIDNGSAITDDSRKFAGKSVKEICGVLLRSAPESFSVQDYPPTPTIAYWILDAASSMGVPVPPEASQKITRWALQEFGTQVSLVSSSHHAMMDPIALAMAANVFRVLRRIGQTQGCVQEALAKNPAPTDYELLAAIQMFFGKQNAAGVWEKYFPLFHYPAAGPNHCWHFEVLEAIFNEFPEIMSDTALLSHINRSLEWLERNRLQFMSAGKLFTGWNSGGDFKALRSGEPESWPTGVAHMCLGRLQERLSEQIGSAVLEKYRDRTQFFVRKDVSGWQRYLDCDLPSLDKSRGTVKKLFEAEVLEPAEDAVKQQGTAHPNDPAERPFRLSPSFSMRGRRSALLFGPPGTAKTSLAEAMAQRLGWPFVELSPSDFLQRGLDGIYDRVREVFEDLMDLYGVVVLFDEMDALVQSRDANDKTASPLDVTQKFLTTSMLPKLLKLRKQGRVIFFMATNHQQQFDAAIKRAGRFDLLVCLGPPSLEEKLEHLKAWAKGEIDDEFQAIAATIREWIRSDPECQQKLRRFTYGEMDSFLGSIRRALPSQSLKDIHALEEDSFKSKVKEGEGPNHIGRRQ